MRLSKLKNIFSISKFQKLNKDFYSPWKALLASSGMLKKDWKLKTKDGYIFNVNRGDVPIWNEYFSSDACEVVINKELFHIIPNNPEIKDYFIPGLNDTITTQKTHWFNSSKTSALVIELEKAEKSYFSQHGEDGVLDYLFKRIPIKHSFIVEFGAYDGLCMSNSRFWIKEKNWSAYLIEADNRFYKGLSGLYKGHSHVKYQKAMVDEENINILFKNAGVPEDFEILSIDIDSIDYYVWEALTEFSPKVVMIEYNSTILPDIEYVVPRDKVFEYAGTEKEGASILSFYNLGKSKGYHLVYGELSGANLIFVHESCMKYLDYPDISPEEVYQPPQFGVIAGGIAPNGRGYLNATN